jgi:2-oxoglutarate ferredoxin oxidoreductase subunit delta
MAKVTFREDLCKGCGLCVSVCPKKIIDDQTDVLNDERTSSRRGESDRICA